MDDPYKTPGEDHSPKHFETKSNQSPIFKVVEETATHRTYQYNSLVSWAYPIVMVLAIWSYQFNSKFMLFFVLLAITFYLLLLFSSYFGAGKQIREARKCGSIELSGSKYSFSNPLKIKIPKRSSE